MKLFIFGIAVLLNIFCQRSFGAVPSESPREQFLHSFETNKEIVLGLIDTDISKRLAAAKAMQSPPYQSHIEKYLNYYKSMAKYDIFEGVIEARDIETLEVDTRSEFSQLFSEMFEVNSIKGESFFRFYLAPDQFFVPEYQSFLKISKDVSWQWLFEQLRLSLPTGTSYTTQLRIDPKRPGGTFDREKNEIVFGTNEPNVSTVLGFIHEFGHSVFLIPSEESRGLTALATNESYAEIWAAQVLKFPFANKIFESAIDPVAVTKYLRFRDLLTLRFDLYALDLDRKIHNGEIQSVEAYKAVSKLLSLRYLLVNDFPPALPILPQSTTPGYLQAYLAIPFLKDYYQNQVEPNAVVKSLIQLGPVLVNESAPAKFKMNLLKAVKAYHRD